MKNLDPTEVKEYKDSWQSFIPDRPALPEDYFDDDDVGEDAGKDADENESISDSD